MRRRRSVVRAVITPRLTTIRPCRRNLATCSRCLGRLNRWCHAAFWRELFELTMRLGPNTLISRIFDWSIRAIRKGTAVRVAFDFAAAALYHTLPERDDTLSAARTKARKLGDAGNAASGTRIRTVRRARRRRRSGRIDRRDPIGGDGLRCRHRREGPASALPHRRKPAATEHAAV